MFSASIRQPSNVNVSKLGHLEAKDCKMAGVRVSLFLQQGFLQPPISTTLVLVVTNLSSFLNLIGIKGDTRVFTTFHNDSSDDTRCNLRHTSDKLRRSDEFKRRKMNKRTSQTRLLRRKKQRHHCHKKCKVKLTMVLATGLRKLNSSPKCVLLFENMFLYPSTHSIIVIILCMSF